MKTVSRNSVVSNSYKEVKPLDPIKLPIPYGKKVWQRAMGILE